MSEDLEHLESDAVGRIDALEHEAVSAELTPEERATDTELALIARRKWRRAVPGVPDLICPLEGTKVPDEPRARASHIAWHKDQERMRAATGLPPGHVALTVDYASLAERSRHHAHAAVVVAFLAMLVTAVVIVIAVT
jgi:hypothetical protein